LKEKIFKIKERIGNFFSQVVYVLRASKKPSEEEVIEYLKIVLFGILLLGIIGFFVSLIFMVVGL
jgi:protein translocase SEC61 complex gamma subunit